MLVVTALILLLIAYVLVFGRPGNVTISYYDSIKADEGTGYYSMGPCKTNKLSENNNIKFVFTEPFSHLYEFKSAAIKKTVPIDQGKATTSLLPGKYGLYLEFKDGTKQLYNDLTLGNARNDQPRDEQGPWYVKINPPKNDFDFKVTIPC